jgi:alkylation response protein AidB-like acyl-CoA dehydrogenase
MEFGLSAEEAALSENLGRMLARVSPLDAVRKAADAPSPYGAELRTALAEMGLFGLLAPESAGGLGMGVLAAAVAAEALGRATAPAAFLGPVLGALALAEGEDQGFCSAHIEAVISGERSVGLALEEFAAGARRDFGLEARGGKLNGKSLFALDVEADGLVIAATPKGEVHAFEASAAGVVIEPLTSIDKTRKLVALHLDDVAATRLCGSGALARRLVDMARVLLAADALGAASSMLERAVDYAKERKQFGRVIGSFQAVKHLCAECAAELEPARALVWHAAHAQDARAEDASAFAAHAKAHLSEVGQFVARTTTEVHGGMGITDLLGLHFAFKRIGLDRQMLGSPEKTRADAARFQGLIPA